MAITPLTSLVLKAIMPDSGGIAAASLAGGCARSGSGSRAA